MRRLVLALIMIASPSAIAAQDVAQDRAEITRIKEQDWNGYYRNRDVAGLDAFLAEGFSLLGADGSVEGKSAALAYVRDNDWPLATRDFRYDVLDIQFPDANTANVFGIGSWDGESCRMEYVSSNILVRKDDRWQALFSHTSPASCSQGE